MGLEHFDLLVFYNFNDLNPFFQEKLFLKKLYINRLYPELTLLLIAASILLIVFNPDSNRTYLIAGDLALLGFPLNIAGYVMKKTKSNRVQTKS